MTSDFLQGFRASRMTTERRRWKPSPTCYNICSTLQARGHAFCLPTPTTRVSVR